MGAAAWWSARLSRRCRGTRFLREFEWFSQDGCSDCARAGVWREPGWAGLRPRISGPGVSRSGVPRSGLPRPGVFAAIPVGVQPLAADWKPTPTGLWRGGGLLWKRGCWIRCLDAGISHAGCELWTRQLLSARLKLVYEQEQHESVEGAEQFRRLPLLWWRAQFWRRARTEGA